jgi:hypothetical protein
MDKIVEMIDLAAQARPSAIEFEMTYQVRISADRVRFAIKHAEEFSKPCAQMRDAATALLEALDRLESLDRRFQQRSRIHRDGLGTAR